MQHGSSCNHAPPGRIEGQIAVTVQYKPAGSQIPPAQDERRTGGDTSDPKYNEIKETCGSYYKSEETKMDGHLGNILLYHIQPSMVQLAKSKKLNLYAIPAPNRCWGLKLDTTNWIAFQPQKISNIHGQAVIHGLGQYKVLVE